MLGIDTIKLYARSQGKIEPWNAWHDVRRTPWQTPSGRHLDLWVGRHHGLRLRCWRVGRLVHLTGQVTLSRLITPLSNLILPAEEQGEALALLKEAWRQAAQGLPGRVSRLDCTLDLVWPARLWPSALEALQRLEPRWKAKKISDAKSIAWKSKRRAVVMYSKTEATARFEVSLVGAEALAKGLPGGVLEGLNLDDLVSVRQEVCRLLLLKAADDLGFWAVERRQVADAWHLAAAAAGSTAEALKLMGWLCLVEACGAKGAEELLPVESRRSAYRLKALASKAGLVPAAAPASLAEALWRALVPADSEGPAKLRGAWHTHVHSLKEALRAARNQPVTELTKQAAQGGPGDNPDNKEGTNG